MEREEFQLKELEVSIAESLSLQEFDLVVGSFQGAGADGVFVPVQNAGAMYA